MWGTDMTQTITVRDGRANVFVTVEHANSEVVGIHASRSANRFEAKVHMIRCHLARDDLQLVLRRNLPQEVAHPHRNLSGQHPLAVLGAPHQVNLQVILRVTAQTISSHNATSSTLRFA